MARSIPTALLPTRPTIADVIELSKPLTWFPPMWAFMCGVVASGVPVADRGQFLIAGLLLTGPLVCGTSQAINDWFDRDVDRINEPDRPIPSGRIPGRWGLGIAIAGTAAALLVAALTGPWVLAATALGLICAWAYSAPPIRLKTSGWFGPATVALTYEGLTWFTGTAVMAGARPDAAIITVLLLYSAGAFGIMTLNDFKAVTGDTLTGVRSLPVRLGAQRAARLACVAMALPQVAVVLLLARWELVASAVAVAVALVVQIGLMTRLLRDPRRHAPWYNATGTTLYVLGMLAAAIGLGSGR